MNLEINIKYFLKDGDSDTISFGINFAKDRQRNELVIVLSKLQKGGYVSFIQLSQLISKFSNGSIILNPIHINKFNISCNLDGNNYSVKQILNLSGDCDSRKFKEINWSQIKQD